MAIINPKNYFATIVAVLLIIGIAIGSFVYGIFTNNSPNVPVDEMTIATPTGEVTPSGPPMVPAPTTPPPGF